MDAIRQMQYLLETLEVSSIYHNTTLILLRNLPKIYEMNIVQVAEMCYTSQATISKLIKYLNFISFSAFKIAVAQALAARTNSMHSQDHGATLPALLERHADTIQAQNKRILETQREQIAQAALMLLERPNVILSAYSISPTSNFISEMLLSGKNMRIIKTATGDRAYVREATGEDTYLTFTHSASDWAFRSPRLSELKKKDVQIIGISSDLRFVDDSGIIDCVLKFDGSDGLLNTYFEGLYLHMITAEYVRLSGGLQS